MWPFKRKPKKNQKPKQYADPTTTTNTNDDASIFQTNNPYVQSDQMGQLVSYNLPPGSGGQIVPYNPPIPSHPRRSLRNSKKSRKSRKSQKDEVREVSLPFLKPISIPRKHISSIDDYESDDELDDYIEYLFDEINQKHNPQPKPIETTTTAGFKLTIPLPKHYHNYDDDYNYDYEDDYEYQTQSCVTCGSIMSISPNGIMYCRYCHY